MGVTNFTYDEVRIRSGSSFTQIPNYCLAAETLPDGTFIHLTTNNKEYRLASQDERATHFTKRSGIARITPTEIVNNTGRTVTGEPVQAVTGLGTVQIPVYGNCSEGQTLTVTPLGYATAWSQDTGDVGAFIIGKALEDITDNDDNLQWIDCFINLPAQWSPSVISETERI